MMLVSPRRQSSIASHPGSQGSAASFSPARLPLFRDSFASETGLSAPCKEHGGITRDSTTLTPENSSDAVLLRCRSTIERLHAEAETERQKSGALRQHVVTLQADLHATRAELEYERNQRTELEAAASRLERRVAEAESRLEGCRSREAAAAGKLQKAKAELGTKSQELTAWELRVSELQAVVERLDARASTAHAQAAQAQQEVRDMQERLWASEREVTRLRTSAEGDAEERVRCSEESRELRQRSLPDEQEELRVIRERLLGSEREVAQLRAAADAEELRETRGQLVASEQLVARLHEQVEAEALRASFVDHVESELKGMLRRSEQEETELQEALQRAVRGEGEAHAALEAETSRAMRADEEMRDAQERLATCEHATARLRSEMVQEDRAVQAEERRLRCEDLERELQGAQALHTEEELSRRLQQKLQQSEEQLRQRSEDAGVLADLLTQTQRHVAELELGRQESEQISAVAALREREVQLEASTAWESKIERLRHKYRHNMAKMYRHLSEREAYEQKLKSYIETEVGALQQYSHELEDYWQNRCRRQCASGKGLPPLDHEGLDELNWEPLKSWRRYERVL